MARRRSFRRRATKSGKNLVWITTVVEASVLEATATVIADVVLPGDWSVGNTGFDRCTLMAIRGWLGYSQQAAATAAEATGMYAGIFIDDESIATGLDAGDANVYVDNDCLWTDGLSLTATTGTAGPFLSRQLEIKAKRRLTTGQRVIMCATVAPDTGAAPRVNFNGVVRALIQTD